MKKILALLIVLSGCSVLTGGAPEIMELGDGKYFISSKTGLSYFVNTEKAAKKFHEQAVKLCGSNNYTESEIREWHMEQGPIAELRQKVTIKDGVIQCH